LEFVVVLEKEPDLVVAAREIFRTNIENIADPDHENIADLANPT